MDAKARAPSRLTRLFGLHGQVALVALVLLVIPWVGYTYVKSMEKLLRENQEQQVIAAARGIATALQDRPRLLQLHGPTQKLNAQQQLKEFPAIEIQTPPPLRWRPRCAASTTTTTHTGAVYGISLRRSKCHRHRPGACGAAHLGG